MPKILKPPIACLVTLLALGWMPLWGAPSQKEAAAGPVPAPIVAAKKVFISNAGGGCDLFSGSPDRAYNEFYAAVKDWGRYELAAAPADADLDFEIGLACPIGFRAEDLSNRVLDYDPQLTLVILDVKTHIVLWGFTEHVEMAILQGNRDKNFDRALSALVEDLKRLVAGPAPSSGAGPDRS
jgi:hypothetical protein